MSNENSQGDCGVGPPDIPMNLWPAWPPGTTINMYRNRSSDRSKKGVSKIDSIFKRRFVRKILPQKVQELVPESKSYIDMLALEPKLDFTLWRKRFQFQESLKRHTLHKKKMRVFLTNKIFPAEEGVEGGVGSWQLKIEGQLIDSLSGSVVEPLETERKFTSFFKCVVIELDQSLYGPDNHVLEWSRTPSSVETDGFTMSRPGDVTVTCNILMVLRHQPIQFKLDQRLAGLLGVEIETKHGILSALWQYIKVHRLQDQLDKEVINCDSHLKEIFHIDRMKFAEIPEKLNNLLHAPDPIVINHVINGDLEQTHWCFNVYVDVENSEEKCKRNFLSSLDNYQEIQSLDTRIHETMETINQLETCREFYLAFAKDPQVFLTKWLQSQNTDLEIVEDGGKVSEKGEFHTQPWATEGVARYLHGKIQQRRAELESSLGVINR